MNITPEQENFDQLRRLLALKRHEQPPPGYFNSFSGQVLARIKAAKNDRGTALNRLFQEAPWMQRLWAVLEAKPALPGVFAACVCVLLVSGVIYSEKVSYPPANLEASASGAAVTPAVAAPVIGLDQMAMMASSTNPVVQPIGSLFDQILIDPQPAGFRPGGN